MKNTTNTRPSKQQWETIDFMSVVTQFRPTDAKDYPARFGRARKLTCEISTQVSSARPKRAGSESLKDQVKVEPLPT